MTASAKKVGFNGTDTGEAATSFSGMLPVTNKDKDENQDWANSGSTTFKTYLHYGENDDREDTVSPAIEGRFAAVHVTGSVGSSTQDNGLTYDLTVTVPANCIVAVLGDDTNNASNYHIATLTNNVYTYYSNKDLTQTAKTIDLYVWADGINLSGNSVINGNIVVAFAQHV